MVNDYTELYMYIYLYIFQCLVTNEFLNNIIISFIWISKEHVM